MVIKGCLGIMEIMGTVIGSDRPKPEVFCALKLTGEKTCKYSYPCSTLRKANSVGPCWGHSNC